jgi:D-galactarolactone cycloisomerase
LIALSVTAPLPPVSVARVEAWVFRYPVATPVRTSFGTMHDRPALLLQLTDADGTVGFGEIWCNFPAVGAEHRARLVMHSFAPMLEGQTFVRPEHAFEELSARSAVLAIQSGEYGPLAQVIAGLDIAMWDLAAKKAGVPLWRLLGGFSNEVSAYASGINPDQPERIAAEQLASGHRAFKLKIGFGAERDLENLEALRRELGDAVPIMADANQAWDFETARTIIPQLGRFSLGWLEEPVRADEPLEVWRRLADLAEMPLAAGENVSGFKAFDTVLESKTLGVVQPDLAKWGGFSGCWPVAKATRGAGLRYCPHWLGGGIGLLASAHLLAAIGGDGLLEVDSNPNPLRDALCGDLLPPRSGICRIPDGPGLGNIADPAMHRGLAPYRVEL